MDPLILYVDYSHKFLLNEPLVTPFRSTVRQCSNDRGAAIAPTTKNQTYFDYLC